MLHESHADKLETFKNKLSEKDALMAETVSLLERERLFRS